jgi:hypothetical protein
MSIVSSPAYLGRRLTDDPPSWEFRDISTAQGTFIETLQRQQVPYVRTASFVLKLRDQETIESPVEGFAGYAPAWREVCSVLEARRAVK